MTNKNHGKGLAENGTSTQRKSRILLGNAETNEKPKTMTVKNIKNKNFKILTKKENSMDRWKKFFESSSKIQKNKMKKRHRYNQISKQKQRKQNIRRRTWKSSRRSAKRKND